MQDPEVKAEADLRAAGSVFLTGVTDSALTMLRAVVESHAGTDVAARAQFLVGEAMVAQGKPGDAIVEFNRVLSQYFQHKVAASAQYRVARALDEMGRRADATGSYQAVVSGYPLEPEAPAAAYLAGVGLMEQNKPLAATPYFQLVLDRYAGTKDKAGRVVFARPEHQELVEAALCLLELCYHSAGDLGQLSGAPHLLLQAAPRQPLAVARLCAPDRRRRLGGDGTLSARSGCARALDARFPGSPGRRLRHQAPGVDLRAAGQGQPGDRVPRRRCSRAGARAATTRS